MDDEFDLDAANYSRKELLDLCGIPGDGTELSVRKATDALLLQYGDNPPVRRFFRDARERLLRGKEAEASPDEEGSSGASSGASSGEDSDGEGLDATDIYRKQHETGNDPPVPARSDWELNVTDRTTSSIPVQRQSYLGAREVKQIPYAQGTINPRVKNVTRRLVNVDSQYRSMPGGKAYAYPQPGCSTDYSVTLSEPLKNTMSISLSSYEIPYSWVGIDPARGNNKMVLVDVDASGNIAPGKCLSVPAGNWNLKDLSDKLNPPPPLPPYIELKVGEDGLITLGVTPPPAVGETARIYFWGDEVGKACAHGCTALSNNYQNTLGWMLGFRQEFVELTGTPPVATATAFSAWANKTGLIGPAPPISPPVPPSGGPLDAWELTQYIPYLYIALEDHNKNHNNKGLLNIVPVATSLRLPSYAAETGMGPTGPCDGASAEAEPFRGEGGEVIGGLYAEPQTLTQAQLYTIASIKSNRTFISRYSVPTGPTNPDILAKITLPTLTTADYGKFITAHGSSLELSERAYFGPVDLERFTIRLLDNNGELMNLNNRDWSFSLCAEQLYQF